MRFIDGAPFGAKRPRLITNADARELANRVELTRRVEHTRRRLNVADLA